jgi:hypothetical protein
MNHDERGHDEPAEARLAKLIGARSAVANPTVLARARARIAARADAPGVAVWLAKPAVLAGAGVLFALCMAGAVGVSQRATTSTSETGIMASLLGDDDLGLPIDTNASDTQAGTAAGDSGEVTP